MSDELCRKNKENRSKQVIPHTGGSKPLSRKRHEMFLETGQKPSRGKLYIETHKKKDGSLVNDAAKGIVEQIEVGLTQSCVDESIISPNDVVADALKSTGLAELGYDINRIGSVAASNVSQDYN
ncbi:hypothetical protein QL285_033183 [Trifolium repens]|nr:hypothetical protein QL285_033183 [Trifolium repens]